MVVRRGGGFVRSPRFMGSAEKEAEKKGNARDTVDVVR